MPTRDVPMTYGGNYTLGEDQVTQHAHPQTHAHTHVYAHGWSMADGSATNCREDSSSSGEHLVSDDSLSLSHRRPDESAGDGIRNSDAPGLCGHGSHGKRKHPPSGRGGGYRMGPKKSFLLRKRIMEAEELSPCVVEGATNVGASGWNANGREMTHYRGNGRREGPRGGAWHENGMPETSGAAGALSYPNPTPNATCKAEPYLGIDHLGRLVASNARLAGHPTSLPKGNTAAAGEAPVANDEKGRGPPVHGFGRASGIMAGDGRARLASLIGLLRADVGNARTSA